MVKLSQEELKAQQLKSMASKSYNGWKNWQSWAAALWLENDFNMYQNARRLAEKGSFVSTNRTAQAYINWAAEKEGFRTPMLKRLFRDSVSYREISKSLKGN